MPYHPIVLGVSRPQQKAGASSGQKMARTPTELEDLKLRIFSRDDYTCACCGYRAERHQELLYKDGNPFNQSEDNLVTTCIFCHQCFDLEHAGRLRSGVLIWLPEMAQPVLNHLIRAVYVLRAEKKDKVPYVDTANQILDMLLERRNEARLRIGTDDPRVLATVMKDFVEPRLYAKRKAMLKGIRLMPLDRRKLKDPKRGEFNAFPEILAYWRKNGQVYADNVPATWNELYAEMKARRAA